MNKLVTVIIPTYNRSGTIIKAVKSVLNQTYRNIEIIIVDDCSVDQTEKVVQDAFRDNPKVRYKRLPKNSGACVARNVGIGLAKGEYIAFLDSDDEFLPKKIELQIHQMKESGADLCATDYERIDKDGNKSIIKTYSGSRSEVYNRLLYCNFVTTGTLIGKRECFEDISFDERLPRYQDWDLVLQLAKRYQFIFIDQTTLLQEYQSVSITASTNHKKTFFALQTIYDKNLEGYRNNKLADSQIKWLMGINSMYNGQKPCWKFMWDGATENKIILRRIIIILLYRLNLGRCIENKI